jgi:hypothetical protein
VGVGGIAITPERVRQVRRALLERAQLIAGSKQVITTSPPNDVDLIGSQLAALPNPDRQAIWARVPDVSLKATPTRPGAQRSARFQDCRLFRAVGHCSKYAPSFAREELSPAA